MSTSTPRTGSALGDFDRDARDRFELLSKLGSGGMADIFLAVQRGEEAFQRLVVIKKIHRQQVGSDAALGMFVDEARTIASLSHPHIVKIFELSKLEGELAIVMEYVDGESLQYVLSRLRKGGRALPLQITLKLFLDAADALHHAHTAVSANGHALELIHRDISPSNLMLDSSGYLKVIDFGIAKTAIQTELTSPGGLKGKLSYLAPECFRRRDVDHRIDVYALGLVLFEALTLERGLKLTDEPIAEVMEAVQGLELPRPSTLNGDVPKSLDDVVRRATAKDPNERFPTMEAFARALNHVANEIGGAAAASDVKSWFHATFQNRLDRRREFERDAMVRADEERLQRSSDAKASSGIGKSNLDTLSRHGERTSPNDERAIDDIHPVDGAPKTPATQVVKERARMSAFLPLAAVLVLMIVAGAVLRFVVFAPTSANVALHVVNVGAQVFLDDALVGTVGDGPILLYVAPEVRAQLRVALPSHVTFTSTIVGPVDDEARIDVRLERLLDPTVVTDDDDALKRLAAKNPDEEADKVDVDEVDVDVGHVELTDDKVEDDDDDGNTRAPPSGAKTRRNARASKQAQTSSPSTKNDKTDLADKRLSDSPAGSENAGDQNAGKTHADPERANVGGAVASAPPTTKLSAPSTAVAAVAPTSAVVPPPTSTNEAALTTTKVASATPKPPAPSKTAFYSGDGSWSGARVVEQGCARCHNGKKTAVLDVDAKSTRQWERFFDRDQHRKVGDLNSLFSSSELARARDHVVAEKRKKDKRGIAGVR